MQAIVIVEIVCAVFLSAIFIAQISEHNKSRSGRRLTYCMPVVIFSLLIDMAAYCFLDATTPFVFRYVICLLAYTCGGVCFFVFSYYSEAYFAEKTVANPWTFRILRIAEGLWILAAAAEFLSGKLVVYENGVEVADNGFPIWLTVLQICVMFYTPVVAFINRKTVGPEAVVLLSLFYFTPVIGVMSSLIIKNDYSYAFGAVGLVLVSEFLQNKQTQKQFAQLETHKALVDNNARFFALEDDFESLYDVDFETGYYDIYVKGDFYRRNVLEKLSKSSNFFVDLHDNIEEAIYPEDREGLNETLTKDAICTALSNSEHFDYHYRIITENGPAWLKMRVVYKDAAKKNIIIGVFNAEEEMAARQKEEMQHAETETRLQHEQLLSEVMSRMIDYDDDPVEVLKGYAERLRVLIGCDQVIYRDLEDTRIMVNSPAIEKTWAVPIEYCQQCLHFDAHHPMYAGGYTEMDNCQEGWQGIPVYHDCPIKSSLTRIVYVDGEVAGYLAIHYVQDYHHFTDIERKTIEEFTRILSISLSRYAARLESKDKKRYDLLHEIINSGKWSFQISADDKVVSADYSPAVMRVIDNDFSSGVDDWVQILHPDDRDATLAAFNAAIADHTGNTPYDVTYRMADRKGEYHWFHSAGRIIRDQDGNGEFFGIHINITDQIEQQLEQQKQLQAAREAADAANQSKSNFLFNMSHDIRTPMNAIKGFTSMAKKNVGNPEKVSEYLDKIDISGQQLLTLINQVLEMARIESGKMEFKEKAVNVRQEFNSMVTVIAEQAATHGLEFEYSLTDLEHNRVFADEARMNSIMVNILGNAMKYTPAGGRVRFLMKELPCRKLGYATYSITVADTGIGMSKEFLGEIYEPFSREKSTTVSKIQGTGLGMSIVKNTIDLMGGSIDVQSEPGKGTSFDIILDFRIDENGAEEESSNESVPVASFKGRRVLLVEDNEMNREIARDLLEEQGLTVEDADDGDVAVEKVRDVLARGESGYYDFILMDIQMPRMNGFEATREIRAMQEPLGVHIPIIAMTANAFEEDRQNALAAGMDEHLAKPIDVQTMFTTIARVLQ